MKPNPTEYKPIIKKLVQKTREGRVQWQTPTFGSIQYEGVDTFLSGLGSEPGETVSFTITANRAESVRSLVMKDSNGSEIFAITSNDLPTSRDEEEVSMLLDELYDVARRQALRVEQKLELASSLLDRV